MILLARLSQVIFVLALFSVTSQRVFADNLRIAVASNFSGTAKALAPLFKEQTGHSILISSASTGKLFSQIKNGAPFDILLAADVTRPALIEQESELSDSNRFTYSLGKLVVWSATESQLSAEVLQSARYKRLAIANPRHAPYGLAARQTLEKLDLWPLVQSKLVRAENVNQALQFVVTGNAELGFTSLAQIRQLERLNLFTGSYWLVPSLLHEPLEQQAIMLQESDVARQFLVFIKTAAVQQIIRDHGYDID